MGKPDTRIIPGYVNSVCACVWKEKGKGVIIPLFSLISDHYTCMHCFLFRSVLFGGVERRELVTGKRINQTKTPKSLSDLNVGDTVVAKWGTKEFEATILKVSRFIQLPLP